MTDARAFYGPSYDKANNKTKLETAVRYLDMACRADSETKENMALNAAVKAEAEAFA